MFHSKGLTKILNQGLSTLAHTLILELLAEMWKAFGLWDQNYKKLYCQIGSLWLKAIPGLCNHLLKIYS
jgi:hypothetical protein